MVSRSSRTEDRRHNKRSQQGKKRKKENERKGSTPKFPIHPEGEQKKK
jgi:hypothetical protein